MTVKIFLNEDEIPRQWYNIAADMPNPMQPPLHPGTLQPVGPQDLAPVFPMNLIEQEVSQERWIDIPDEVLDKLLNMASEPPVSCGEAREVPELPGKNLLQERRSQSRREPQTEHCNSAGLLQ